MSVNLDSSLHQSSDQPVSSQEENSFLKLPVEIQFRIFSFCNLQDLPALQGICKQLEAPSKDLSFQINLFAKYFFNFEKKIKERLLPMKFKIQNQTSLAQIAGLDAWDKALQKLKEQDQTSKTPLSQQYKTLMKISSCLFDLREACAFSLGICEGAIDKDHLDGQGKIFYADGEIHEGIFKGGILNGKGKKILPDREAMEEQISNLNREGWLKYPADIWEGEFRDGELNGSGKGIYIDGTTYIGDFKNDEAHGQGKIILVDGAVYEGTFEHGRAKGRAKISFPDRTVFEGIFKKGKLNGKGKKISRHGEIFKGIFINNKLQNDGKLIYSHQAVYKGKFKNNKPEGLGKITYPDGRIEEGLFKMGVLVQSTTVYP